MDYSRASLDKRYQNDANFHMLVTMLYQAISKNGFTPSELREAIFLAHYKYEMENPYAIQTRIIAQMDLIYKGNIND